MSLYLKIFRAIMNYLGHAYLSMGNADTLCGNMIGDFVKGLAALDDFPPAIKTGLLLHRHIDSFTDEHPAVSNAKQIFRPVYGLYSGAFVDTILDYFIANDTRLFENQGALDAFAQNVYRQLATKRQYFPQKFIPYYESMVTHNWLAHYRTEEGLMRALQGLMRRAKHIVEVDSAFALFRQHEDELKVLYLSFINDIIRFVKIELHRD